LTSGPVPPNPAELIGSEEMRNFLGLLSEQYAHIIIDSPPAISFTDASILSTMVDGVILVVHGGRSSRAVVRRAKQQLLDVGAGDEVITTPFSFFATASAIARLGARPVFVDIDPLTYNLNVDQIAAAITACTKVVLPVHLYGQMAEMDRIVELCGAKNLIL